MRFLILTPAIRMEEHGIFQRLQLFLMRILVLHQTTIPNHDYYPKILDFYPFKKI